MNHFITNFNIKDPRVEQNIKANFPNKLDFCYTDPPWGSGNLNYWKTMNQKMTGANSDLINQVELEEIFTRLIVQNVKNYAFIVYGIREMDSAIAMFKKYSNVTNIQHYFKTYRSGNKILKNVVICVTLNDAPIVDWSGLENLQGLKGLQYVCEKFKNNYKTCLELFVGIGYYLNILNKYGYIVCGNELNSARLKKALSKL